MSLRWLPNAISLLRIALVPPIIVLMLHDRFAAALAVFIVAGFSDGLDGYLAKRFDWHSRAGALLDGIADKLLIAGTFVTTAYIGLVPAMLAAIVVVRDIGIVGGAMAYNFLVRPVEADPSRISKINTAFELALILFVLSRAGYGWPDRISITVLGAAVTATVVISGADYVRCWTRKATA